MFDKHWPAIVSVLTERGRLSIPDISLYGRIPFDETGPAVRGMLAAGVLVRSRVIGRQAERYELAPVADTGEDVGQLGLGL